MKGFFPDPDETLETVKRIQAPSLDQIERERLGLSSREYAQLKDRQQAWEAQRDSGQPYVKTGPYTMQESANSALRQKLNMNDKDFADLMKRQSDWAERRDSGGAYPKTDPVTMAVNAANPLPVYTPIFDQFRK